MTTVRVSIMRASPDRFAALSAMMIEAEAALRPGIEAMPGLLAFFAGVDEATSSLTNTSVWETLDAARQLDSFQPMLDLAKKFADAGATFERPIMNYNVQWQIGSHG